MNSVFDKYYKQYDAWYDRNEFAYLSEVEALRSALPSWGKGLEIGVGTGRFATALGIDIGIDPSKDMLEIARRRGVSARWGVGEDLPFLNNSFGYVAIIITLCFVRDPEKVLKEAWRVLGKDGKIIIGIIDKDSFLGKFYQKKKSAFYKEANFFSVGEVTALLKSTGFKDISYLQTVFHLPGEITSIEKFQKGFDKGGFIVISAQKKDEHEKGN